jgi:hypothetical protein
MGKFLGKGENGELGNWVGFGFLVGRVKLESKIFFLINLKRILVRSGYNLLLKYDDREINFCFRRFRFEFNFEKNKHYA